MPTVLYYVEVAVAKSGKYASTSLAREDSNTAEIIVGIVGCRLWKWDCKTWFVMGQLLIRVETSTWPGKGGTKTRTGRDDRQGQGALPVPMILVALMVTLKVPNTSGVPEINRWWDPQTTPLAIRPHRN